MRVEARKLSMQYNDAGRIIDIFRDLDLFVESGHSLAVVGESGVGKTTLLYLLGILDLPLHGELLLGDEVFTRERLRSKREFAALFRGENIGFIFQFHHLLPEFDALENVAMPLIIQGLELNEAKEEARKILNRVGLADRLEHRPSMLSGGEQQRVAIARALVGKPGVLLADEPTGNLDLDTAVEVQRLLLELQREQGTTLIVVTHSLEFAHSLERTVVLTRQGLQEQQAC